MGMSEIRWYGCGVLRAAMRAAAALLVGLLALAAPFLVHSQATSRLSIIITIRCRRKLELRG